MAFVLGLASPLRPLLRCSRKSLMWGTQGLPSADVLLNSLCNLPASIVAMDWLLNCTSGSPASASYWRVGPDIRMQSVRLFKVIAKNTFFFFRNWCSIIPFLICKFTAFISAKLSRIIVLESFFCFFDLLFSPLRISVINTLYNLFLPFLSCSF